MGRILLYFSAHWIRFRVSSREKKLCREIEAYRAETETLKSRLAELTVGLETEKVKNEIQQLEICCLTEVIERNRRRVASEIRSYGITDEEIDAA